MTASRLKMPSQPKSLPSGSGSGNQDPHQIIKAFLDDPATKKKLNDDHVKIDSAPDGSQISVWSKTKGNQLTGQQQRDLEDFIEHSGLTQKLEQLAGNPTTTWVDYFDGQEPKGGPSAPTDPAYSLRPLSPDADTLGFAKKFIKSFLNNPATQQLEQQHHVELVPSLRGTDVWVCSKQPMHILKGAEKDEINKYIERSGLTDQLQSLMGTQIAPMVSYLTGPIPPSDDFNSADYPANYGNDPISAPQWTADNRPT